MQNTNLTKLGFDEWFHKSCSEIREDLTIARVIEVNKNSFVVSDGTNEMIAEPSGKFIDFRFIVL